MKINSIRRTTNNRKHNAFTGACWFKGNLVNFPCYQSEDVVSAIY